MGEPNKLSLTHEAIIDWILVNPEKKLKECAATFGYSQSWLSSIINSGAFQAKLAERRLEISSAVALTIPDKLSAITHVALDNIAAHIEKNPDPEFSLKVLQKGMEGLGMGAKANGAPLLQQNQMNIYLGTKEDLAAARRLILEQQQGIPPALPPAIEDVKVIPSDAPTEG